MESTRWITAGVPNLHSSLTDVHRDDFTHYFSESRGARKLLHLYTKLFR